MPPALGESPEPRLCEQSDVQNCWDYRPKEIAASMPTGINKRSKIRSAISNNGALCAEGTMASSVTLGTRDGQDTESTYEQMDVSSCSMLCADYGRKR